MKLIMVIKSTLERLTTYMVKTSSAVQNISINNARVVDVFGSSLMVVRTSKGPGKSPDTKAAAAMAPKIWATIEIIILPKPMAPIRARPRLTCSI